MRRRFVEFQGKGLNASDAASISLKVGVHAPDASMNHTKCSRTCSQRLDSLRTSACCHQMEAGQLRAPVDIAQLVGVLTGSGSSSSSDAEQLHLSTSAASTISDLFSSAPTLVLSLARSPAVQQSAQPQADQLVELDWDAVAQLGQALDGSTSEYVSVAICQCSSTA